MFEVYDYLAERYGWPLSECRSIFLDDLDGLMSAALRRSGQKKGSTIDGQPVTSVRELAAKFGQRV